MTFCISHHAAPAIAKNDLLCRQLSRGLLLHAASRADHADNTQAGTAHT